jgi:hypothetical protein
LKQLIADDQKVPMERMRVIHKGRVLAADKTVIYKHQHNTSTNQPTNQTTNNIRLRLCLHYVVAGGILWYQ